MLLVHQTGSVKVGGVARYTITYDPSADRVVPSPSYLHVKIKNTSPIPLRAAYLHGPYTLHVAAYPSTFDPNNKVEKPKHDGVPQFEPNLKAGGIFTARLTVPEELRITSQTQANNNNNGSSSTAKDGSKRSVTWIIEATSQVLFSASASVSFELVVGRDERSLEYSLAAAHANRKSNEPGQIHNHQQGRRSSFGQSSAQPKGVYSKAITLVVDDADSLWDKPKLPTWEPVPGHSRKSSDVRKRKSTELAGNIGSDKKKKKKIHLVILTHGLHGNLSADMLYLKESIDATAKANRENSRKRREGKKSSNKAKDDDGDSANRPSIAPLSGGQEDLETHGIEDDDAAASDEDDEEVIVRGFDGNAVRTENGIQYLGKRMARWILDFTYPDQPFKPLRKKSMSQKLSASMSLRSPKIEDPGVPAHEHSSIRKNESDPSNLAYTFSSISFVGHSLGGLIQLYAIAYIQKHAPLFFDQIKPVNFIALASPLLGLSNENPMYVKFALDFGLVGRTGQDLGLTWRPPALAKSGWSAMVGGFGSGQKDGKQEDPGAKPLLRILPTGPAHIVLRKFRNRTVYSNVVNDGIVPLRTSCLLFLDWRGLEKIEKARRENGLIGTMAEWGWAEITGQSSSSNNLESGADVSDGEDSDAAAEATEQHETTVPQPPENAVNEDAETSSIIEPAPHQMLVKQEEHGKSTLDEILDFFRPTAKTTKKDLSMYKRSQTIQITEDSSSLSVSKDDQQSRADSARSDLQRPVASRGDSNEEDPEHSNAPPKTTIFESAGDILNPPIPSSSWISDPSSRTRTIFHDRIYHPEDIPPPPNRRPSRLQRTFSVDSSGSMRNENRAGPSSSSSSGMRVEEKIARAYHRDLSWRKVLVRLEPDAHNNMIVRRMFANAYGWPVVKHLCDTHFGDTYAAKTRDEYEPATDRAKGVDRPVGVHGELVQGQESIEPPKEQDPGMLRRASSEMAPLRAPKGDPKKDALVNRDDSVEWDDSYLEDTSDEEENTLNPFKRLWSPPQPKSPAAPESQKPVAAAADGSEAPDPDTVEPEIADFLTVEPAPIGTSRLTQAPPLVTTPSGSTSEVGLRKPAEDMLAKQSGDGDGEQENAERKEGITEQVARLSSHTEENGS